MFFFSRENQKCAWKPFWAFFSVFFTAKSCFHGHFFHFFHAHFSCFTGTFLKFLHLSRTLFWFHAHFLFSFFFTGNFTGTFFDFFHGRKKIFHGEKKNTALINFGKYREIYIFLIKIDFWPPGSIFCQNVEFLIFQLKNRSELRLFTASKDIRNKSSYQ